MYLRTIVSYQKIRLLAYLVLIGGVVSLSSGPTSASWSMHPSIRSSSSPVFNEPPMLANDMSEGSPNGISRSTAKSSFCGIVATDIHRACVCYGPPATSLAPATSTSGTVSTHAPFHRLCRQLLETKKEVEYCNIW